MGNAGIGIIRVSGENAIDICDRIFIGKKKISEMQSYTAAYGHIIDTDIDVNEPEAVNAANTEERSRVIDEVIVLVMKAPHTYTTEDTVEIDCHGGMLVLKKVTELLIKHGARPAEPGEFTKRAYMGGRIDMTEAEAVMDLISAKSDLAHKASVNCLRGGLKDKINELREEILYDTAYIESALDDPENYSLDGFSKKLTTDVDKWSDSVDKLLKTCEDGRLIKEGIRTAIIGRPNVGKSSVLNMLLGEERAIVTDVAGTTRDTLEEFININGIVLNIVDTAGIRETSDIVEKIGVDKARDNIKNADLVLFIIDGSNALTGDDKRLLEEIKDKKVIILINKNDLDNLIDPDLLKSEYGYANILSISALNKEGLDELQDMIEKLFFSGELSYNDEIIITSRRQENALIKVKNDLNKVRESIELSLGEDFYTIDLMAAYSALGLIIGETLEDDLADKIFSEFCMGK